MLKLGSSGFFDPETLRPEYKSSRPASSLSLFKLKVRLGPSPLGFLAVEEDAPKKASKDECL